MAVNEQISRSLKRSWPLGIAFVAAISLVGCGNNDDQQVQKEKAKVVQLTAVQSPPGGGAFTFPSKVVPRTTVDLSFRVSGRMQEINLPEGQYVKKGDVLARLDPEPFERAVRTAKVRLKQAELELKRVQAVATKGIGSEKSVDNAQVSFDLASLDLENARANLKYSVLKAPFDALISNRLIEIEGFIGTGEPIAHLQDLAKIHFKFDVSERLVNKYRRNQISKASAYIGGAINQSFDIKYVEHSTEPNPVSQTYEVVYSMDAPKDRNITPGVRATVTLEANKDVLPQIIGLPVNALVSGSDDQVYVWAYDPSTQRVNKKPVIVGPISGGWVAILGGIVEGQQVVSAGASLMEEGLLVRPYQEQ